MVCEMISHQPDDVRREVFCLSMEAGGYGLAETCGELCRTSCNEERNHEMHDVRVLYCVINNLLVILCKCDVIFFQIYRL